MSFYSSFTSRTTVPSDGGSPRATAPHPAWSATAQNLDNRRVSYGNLGLSRSATRVYPAPAMVSTSIPAHSSGSLACDLEAELIHLREENTKFKTENAELKDQIGGLEYVPYYISQHSHRSQSF